MRFLLLLQHSTTSLVVPPRQWASCRTSPLRATAPLDAETADSERIRKMLSETVNPNIVPTADRESDMARKMLAADGLRPISGTAGYDALLDAGYKKCQTITKAYAKTFYLGTSFLTPEQKRAVWAVYVWCRRTDDIVDSPRAQMQPQRLVKELDSWDERLDKCFAGKPMDSLDATLADTVKNYPSMPIYPYKDMIAGMMMDTPLGQDRYQNFEQLHTYCYRVAGTVGLMTLPVFGCAEGYTMEEAEKPALALGVALQLTNILRDVGEDVARGRIYLPLDDMARFGVTESQILNYELDDNYRALMKYYISLARQYYNEAETGIPMLAESARMPVRTSLDIYRQILDRIEANDYDNFRKRAYVSKAEKVVQLPISYWRSLQAAATGRAGAPSVAPAMLRPIALPPLGSLFLAVSAGLGALWIHDNADRIVDFLRDF